MEHLPSEPLTGKYAYARYLRVTRDSSSSLVSEASALVTSSTRGSRGCYKRGGRGRGCDVAACGNQTYRTNTTSLSNIECRYCYVFGHYRVNCSKLQGGPSSSAHIANMDTTHRATRNVTMTNNEYLMFSQFQASSLSSPPTATVSQIDIPTVAETKSSFLKAYKRPIPSIYNNVLQELLVQQHLMRYKRTYRYDAVFGLGFITIYEQLMEGYPTPEDQDAIFRAYIEALQEDPEQYRDDAIKLEEWGQSQDADTLVNFLSRGGHVENILKDIAGRAQGSFSYSRFYAVGIFRLLELANAAEPSVLEKFCAALKMNKRSVDRDLDVYRNLLSKLVQAKELLKEYVDRVKKKREEMTERQKNNEAITIWGGDLHYLNNRFTELTF